jgi:hypothetical protein
MGVHVEQVVVTGDNSSYERALQQSSTKTAAATKSWTSSFQGFGSVVKTVLALQAVRYVIQFTDAVIQAASHNEEAMNNVKVVFGEAAAAVLDFAKTGADAFNVSENAALDAAGAFGSILKVSGLTEQAAADMSIDLVKLAADLASFKDIEVADALERIRSGLVGEAEPLRTLGILLSETRVKLEAYASGIATAGAELTDAQKVQARYNLLLVDTVDAQGDVARTADSLANQQRDLQEVWDDFQVQLGKTVVPIMNELVGALGATLQTVAPLAPLTDDLLKVLVAYAAVRWLPGFFRALAGSFKLGASGARPFVAGLKDVAKAMALVAVVEGVGGIARQWGTSFEELAAGTGATVDELGRLEDRANEFFGMNELKGFLSLDWSTSKDAARDLGAAWSAAKAELEAAGVPAEEINRIFTETLDVVNADRGSTDLYTAAVGEATKAALANVAANEDRAASHREAADAARLDRVEALKLAGGLVGLMATIDGYNEAQAELNKLKRKGKQGTEEYRDAERGVLTEYLAVKEALVDYAGELAEEEATQREAIRALRGFADQAGLTKREFERLLAEGLGPFSRELDRLDGRKVNVTVLTTYQQSRGDAGRQGGAGQYFPDGVGVATGGIARAASGMIARSPLLVGEGSYDTRWGKGAEAVTPLDDRGIGILSEALGLAMERAGGKGGGHGHPIVIDGYQIARALERDKLRRGG